jgi:hypothetical protein
MTIAEAGKDRMNPTIHKVKRIIIETDWGKFTMLITKLFFSTVFRGAWKRAM